MAAFSVKPCWPCRWIPCPLKAPPLFHGHPFVTQEDLDGAPGGPKALWFWYDGLMSFVTVRIESATVVSWAHWPHLFTEKLFFQMMKRGDDLFDFFFHYTKNFQKSFHLLCCFALRRIDGRGENHVFTFFSSLINCFYCLNLKSTRNMFSDSVKSSSSPKHKTPPSGG